jgi:hypothetical protein
MALYTHLLASRIGKQLNRRNTMSAFICSNRHIATIATRYAKLVGTEAETQAIADALLAINIDSVNYRYGREDEIRACDISEVAPENYQIYDLVALCDCLDYQSCERPNYQNPLLAQITAQFKANCKHRVASNVWSI